MASKEIRSYKRAFERGFDPEDPPYPPRVDISTRQRGWLRRAWMWASTAMLGMNEIAIPDSCPRYNEQRGLHHVPAIKPQFHHITPVGESIRLHGETDYNQPQNLAPVSARLHVGRGVHCGDSDEEMVIHQDTMGATRKWPGHKQRGELSPYAQMQEDRKKATRQGRKYHNDFYDPYLTDLASTVADEYTAAHPEDEWPE